MGIEPIKSLYKSDDISMCQCLYALLLVSRPNSESGIRTHVLPRMKGMLKPTEPPRPSTSLLYQIKSKMSNNIIYFSKKSFVNFQLS